MKEKLFPNLLLITFICLFGVVSYANFSENARAYDDPGTCTTYGDACGSGFTFGDDCMNDEKVCNYTCDQDVPDCDDSCQFDSHCEPDDGGSDPASHRITITKSGGGSGTVTGLGINCGYDCWHDYTTSGNITLSASASSGSWFRQWSIPRYTYCTSSDKNGCNSYASSCGTLSSCRTATTSDKSINAEFIRHTLTASLGSNRSSGLTTDRFDFTATRTGGTARGTVSYTSPTCGTGGTVSNWSGTGDRTFSCTYSSAGSKNARMTVRQGGVSTTPGRQVSVSEPPTPPSVDISADDTALDYRGSTNIRWQPSSALDCDASGSWGGDKAHTSVVHTEGTGSLTGPASYTYTILCTGESGTSPASDSVTVSVAAQPEVTSIDLTADNIWVPRDSDVELTWEAPNANFCTLTDDRGNTLVADDPYTSPDESHTTAVQGVTTYTIDCRNSQTASITDTLTVYILPIYQEI